MINDMREIIELPSECYPNSFGRLNNEIIVCCATSRLLKLRNGRLQSTVGRYGIGRYSFKQLVVLAVEGQAIYVGDWYNHRIIVFNKDLDYVGEMGSYDLNPVNIWKRIRYNFKNPNPIITSHQVSEKTEVTVHYPFTLRVYDYLKYLLTRKVISEQEYHFKKPNGLAFYKQAMWVTQKDNRCISIFCRSNGKWELKKNIYDYAGVRFGRLGNIKECFGSFYVCDEENNLVYVLSASGDELRRLVIKSLVKPFCIDIRDNRVAAIGGVEGIVVIDVVNGAVLTDLTSLKDVHDLMFDPCGRFLNVLDRANSCIHRFRVEI